LPKIPNATRVTDRFHVQKLALRLYKKSIKYRWQAIDQENEAMKSEKTKKSLNLYYLQIMILLTITG
jgi:transposase